MRWLALCSVVATGCLVEHEISGRWNVGGPGGCQLGHVVDVEARDGGEDFERLEFPCAGGRFSVSVPSSAEHFWVAFEEHAGDTLYATATVELERIADDFDVGVVFLVPVGALTATSFRDVENPAAEPVPPAGQIR